MSSEDNARAITMAVLEENGIKGIAGVAVANQIVDSLAEVHLIEDRPSVRDLEFDESIEDYELSEKDWKVLKQCHCAHCEPGDGICPMAVQQLVGDRLRALRDRALDMEGVAQGRLNQILKMCDEWDAITKGETPATTKPIRDIALGREGSHD